MGLTRLISGAGLSALLAAAAPASPSAASPLTVRGIELRCDVSVSRPEELLDWVTLEVGQPFDPVDVARSLRNLHAAGVASRLEAYTTPRADGLAVIFVMRGKTLVEELTIRGNLGLDRRVVVEVVPIGEGEPLLADRVFRGFYALRELYESEGFFGASVRLDVDEDEARRRAKVVFDIDAGRPALITAVSFEGELGELDQATLGQVVRIGPGGRYRQRVAREGRERLETWLLRKGYRLAKVEPFRMERPSEGEVTLHYAIDLGPRFEVEVAEKLGKRLRKRGLLPLTGFERYDESTALEAQSRIRTDYQSRGFYDAMVAVEEVVENDVHRLVVAVEPGEKSTLEKVRFVGNEALSSQRLQGVMRSTEASLLSTESGVLVDVWLDEDLGSIRALYALEGYSQVQVGPSVIHRSEQDLELEIPLVEGPRRTVLDIAVTGAEQLDERALLADLPLVVAGPFHPRRRDEALDLIRARYEAEGYNQAQVSAVVEWSPDGTLATVRIDILEGPRNLVERVIVRGGQRTSPIVMRRVVNLDRGAPVNQRRLLDLQRRLYALGVFSNVDVRLVPGTPYSGGSDVMVEVREGKRQRLTYGIGYDSEDGTRGLIGYSHGNLWGRAVSGRVDLRASQREQQARLLLRQPYIGRFRLPVTYSLFKTDRIEESFRSERRGAQVEVLRSRQHSRWGFLYTYKIVEISEPDPALELLEIDRSLQEVTISSITPSLFLDHRDDAIDPQRGWSATLLTEYAFPAINAEEEFAKLFLQHARYLSLGRAGVVAANVRLGAIEPLGPTGDLDAVCRERELAFPSCEIKISERYFAGGRTTHRAYRRDRLGIPGATLLETDDGQFVPIGGSGMLLANLDYRFPVGAGFGGTLFVDGGNLWPDWRDVSPGQLKWGAGLGVRYSSPIGPIRLEVGWKLDRLPGEDPYVVLFSFGNPF